MQRNSPRGPPWAALGPSTALPPTGIDAYCGRWLLARVGVGRIHCVDAHEVNRLRAVLAMFVADVFASVPRKDQR
ncbi:hypothetical protein ACWC3X_44590, partial [Streptomyces populi]